MLPTNYAYTERARAERLLDAIEADVKTLRDTLRAATRDQDARTYQPLYFTKLTDARTRIAEALSWAHRPQQSSAAITRCAHCGS